MAASVIVDTSFLVTLLSRRETNHRWAAQQAQSYPPPWITCEAVLSEAFHLLQADGGSALAALLRRGSLAPSFRLGADTETILQLMHKYVDVPMSSADACLVRMTETLPDPILLTTDRDFRIYRRHGRQVIPCKMPD
jgi:predicted nucleic acid-binding protein